MKERNNKRECAQSEPKLVYTNKKIFVYLNKNFLLLEFVRFILREMKKETKQKRKKKGRQERSLPGVKMKKKKVCLTHGFFYP